MSELMEKIVEKAVIVSATAMAAWGLLVSKEVDAWWVAVLGLTGCSVSFLIAGKHLLRYSNYRAGLLAEQIVGRMLDQLSSTTVRVFHDLEIKEPGKRPWNIDHVVVMHCGVFAIETKSRRKPKGWSNEDQKGHEIVYDGSKLIFPQPLKYESRSLNQARRNADWLSKLLLEQNGEPILVTPVLVFPGWFVTITKPGDVSVMSHKQLSGFFARRPAILSEQRFRAITAQLAERSRIDLSAPP